MDSAASSNQPSDLDVDALLVSLETMPPFAGHPTEYQLLKYLVVVQRTGEIKAGKSKVIGDFRRHHVLSPTESKRVRMPWKDSAERALYRRLESLLEAMNADPAFAIEILLPSKGIFQLFIKRKLNVALAPAAEFSASPAGEENQRDSDARKPLKTVSDEAFDAPEARPLSPAEVRAEEHVRLISSQVARGRIFRLPPGLAWLAVLAAISAVVVWFLVHYHTTGLSPAVYYGIAGSGCLLVALACRQLLRKRKTNKITIYVARFGTDQQGRKIRELVMRSIEGVLGPDVAEIQRADIALSVAVVCDEAAAYAEARRFLQRERGDVLIWGTAHSSSQMKDGIFVGFSTPGFNYRPKSSFELTPRYSLESSFAPEMGTALAAVAASLAFPSVLHAGPFISAVLEPVADKLSTLVSGCGQMNAVDRGAVLQSYGLIQSAIGGASGDEVRLQAAVDALRAATAQLPKERLPLSWALAQNSLGLALMKLGDQQVGTERLHEAAAAFEAALDETTGEDLPVDRGATLHNLALTFSRIGGRESGSEYLRKAVEVFQRAMETLSENPRLVALVQNSLAVNLIQLGKREKDGRSLEEAVDMATTAVDTFAWNFMPFGWAMAQTTLARALLNLGSRQGQAERLEEAAAAFRRAAWIITRRRAPIQWFNLRVNLAATLLRRGELDAGSTAAIHEAVKVLKAALDVPFRGRDALGWASAQNTLGVSLLRLGEREEKTAWLEASERAYRSALEEWTWTRAPSHWATATNGLASALALLGAHEEDTQKLRESIATFREAEKECTRQNDPTAWAYAQNGLGVALTSLGAQENETESLLQAVTTFQAVLDEWTPEQSPNISSLTRANLERALSKLEEKKKGAG